MLNKQPKGLGAQIRYLMDVLEKRNIELSYLKKMVWNHRHSDKNDEGQVVTPRQLAKRIERTGETVILD